MVIGFKSMVILYGIIVIQFSSTLVAPLKSAKQDFKQSYKTISKSLSILQFYLPEMR